MLFTTLENIVLNSGQVKEHQALHSSSPSLPTSTNSNYYKQDKALILLMQSSYKLKRVGESCLQMENEHRCQGNIDVHVRYRIYYM